MAEIDSGISGVIDSGTQLSVPDNDITVYFAQTGENWSEQGTTYTASGWTAEQTAAAMDALGQISNSVDLTFTQVDSAASATFFLGTRAITGVDATGYFYLPESPDSGTGAFDHTEPTWTGDDAFVPGAFTYSLFLHEFSHGLGLEHPHSDFMNTEGIPGVFNHFDLGDFQLNQSIYTVMSYNEGYVTHPGGALHWSSNYGHAATPMALDIAILQGLYGANTTYGAGNDIYELDGTNGTGSYYSAIWDTGGFDTIANNTGGTSIIDLRPATLQVEVGGGGYVSHVGGVYGGYTVAHDVVIEQALGGSSTDTITGNAADNTLIGNGGSDFLTDTLGNDTLNGGNGNDTLIVGTGLNTLLGGDGSDLLLGGNQADVLNGGDGSDILRGDLIGSLTGGSDQLTGGKGDDFLMGGLGADEFIFEINDGTDTISIFDIGSNDPLNALPIVPSGSDFVPGYDSITLIGFNPVVIVDPEDRLREENGNTIFEAEGTTIIFFDTLGITADDFNFF